MTSPLEQDLRHRNQDPDRSANRPMRTGFEYAGMREIGRYGTPETYSNPADFRDLDHNNQARGFFDRALDEVQSWFGDEDAQRRRESDHRGKGPKNYQRSDARINEDVNARLTDDAQLDASEIEASVSGREVTFSGSVATRFEKRRAEDCADAVPGVAHVQNNLRVQDHESRVE